jgi:hypothetical protein
MGQLNPDPFFEYPGGDWETAMRPLALRAVEDAMRRYRAGLITRDDLCKDMNKEGIKYWLWYMHHKHDNRRKNLGRPYWSLVAYVTWRRYYFDVEPGRRLARDGGAAKCTLQKRGKAKKDGLYHEHVVPQNQSLKLIIDEGVPPAVVLGRNIGAVITVGENDLLPPIHEDPTDPWLRYRGTGIQFIENPKWTKAERDALIRYDLLWTKPIPAFEPR